MTVIDEIRARRQKLADVLESKEYSGIRLIVEELYPDQAHFLFELLQNAQDTGATEAVFALSSEMLVFEHNGRPFDKGDIEGILFVEIVDTKAPHFHAAELAKIPARGFQREARGFHRDGPLGPVRMGSPLS